MLPLLQMVNLRCSLLSFSRFKTLGSSRSWSCLSAAPLILPEIPTPFNTVTSSSDSSSLYTSTVQCGPPGPLCYCSTPDSPSPSNFLSPFPPLRTFSRCTQTTASGFRMLFYTFCFLFPLTSSGFFNKMLAVSKPGALKYFTIPCFILLILFVSRNLILIHLSLSGSLDSLLWDLIAPTPGLVLSLPITHMLEWRHHFREAGLILL